MGKERPLAQTTISGLPTNAKELILRYDFYEIDSLDHDAGDTYRLTIGDQVIEFGTYSQNNDETRAGTAGGIMWHDHYHLKLSKLGFNDDYADQKHDVIVNIPQQYYADGKLSIKFESKLDEGISNESVGVSS